MAERRDQGGREPHALQEYCYSNEQSLADFARELGVSRGTLSNWMHGRRRIEAGIACQIQEMTDGIVGMTDWDWLWFPEDGTVIDKRPKPSKPEPPSTADVGQARRTACRAVSEGMRQLTEAHELAELARDLIDGEQWADGMVDLSAAISAASKARAKFESAAKTLPVGAPEEAVAPGERG